MFKRNLSFSLAVLGLLSLAAGAAHGGVNLSASGLNPSVATDNSADPTGNFSAPASPHAGQNGSVSGGLDGGYDGPAAGGMGSSAPTGPAAAAPMAPLAAPRSTPPPATPTPFPTPRSHDGVKPILESSPGITDGTPVIIADGSPVTTPGPDGTLYTTPVPRAPSFEVLWGQLRDTELQIKSAEAAGRLTPDKASQLRQGIHKLRAKYKLTTEADGAQLSAQQRAELKAELAVQRQRLRYAETPAATP